MRFSPFRTAVLCLFIGLSVSVTAQTEASPQSGTKNLVPDKTPATKTTPAKDPEAERIARERRANAQSLLISLSADAARFNDHALGARTLARIADTLWTLDPEAARTLFRKAWDAAEIAERETQRKKQEERQRPGAKRDDDDFGDPPNLRNEVLRLASKRDRALGEELLAKLKSEQAEEVAERARSNDLRTPEAIKRRLRLAQQLLATNVEQAIRTADPALATITIEGIDFLSYLRAKDAAAADRRYMALLSIAATNIQSEANTVSWLSSYLFSPHVFVTISGNQTMISASADSVPAPEAVAPEIRAAFFRIAASILTRPLAFSGQNQNAAAPRATYFIIRRLLPLFEQFASRELTETMRAQADALGVSMSESARNSENEAINEGIRPRESSANREETLLDKIDRAKTSDQRDDLYFLLADMYASKGDLKAREFVDKIADPETRKSVGSYIDATLAFGAIDRKNSEQALELVRIGALTHLQKSYVLSQVAKLLTKTDREKAASTLEEAVAEANRIANSDPDRPRALMAVANAWLTIERAKTWDALADAVKAANSAEGYAGDDGRIRISVRTKDSGGVSGFEVEDFDVAGIFAELAREDHQRAVELARGFEREAPRAGATIAIARAVLEEKE